MSKKAKGPEFVALFFGALLLFSVIALPIWADTDSSLNGDTSSVDDEVLPDADSDGESGVEASSSLQGSGASGGVSPTLSNLQVHGFLTQAYAEATFVDDLAYQVPGTDIVIPLGAQPSQSEASIGIPEDGTTNYRFLALMFRYSISPKDTFVVQFSSRTLGFSTIQLQEDEVELDWAFYERRLGDNTSLKVGRVQIPYGIYNEVRDVGTVLPFYRPAFVVYKEGGFTSETVDGLSLSHNFFSDSEWSVDATIYAGEWSAVQFPAENPTEVSLVRSKDGYGYQLWLNTPLSDLRIGTALLSFVQEGGPFEIADRRDLYEFSLDSTFGKFTLQAEMVVEDLSLVVGTPSTQNISTLEWYVLAGYRFTDKFSLWVQRENGEFDFEWPGFITNSFNSVFRQDTGLSLNYFFTPSVVLKAEHHWVDEEKFNFLPSGPQGFPLIPLNEKATGGSYTIVALSVSF